jgi:hypothetical protein
MADVFVSYSRRNAPSAENLVEGLKASGFAPWWDRLIPVGSLYQDVITQELDAAKCAVVAWSKPALKSLYVRAEATLAVDAQKIVQLRLDDARPPYPFNAVHMHDFTSWRGERAGEAWDGLDKGVRAVIGGEGVKLIETSAKGPALQDFGAVAWYGWTSIALVLATAALTALAVRGAVDPALYGNLAIGGFAVACYVLLRTFVRVVTTALASRRR